MFSKYFKKKKPNIYLGQLVIVPDEDWSKADGAGLFRTEDVESGLRKLLEETFASQKLSERQLVLDTDLVLDVFISKYTGGEFDVFSSTDIAVPIFWRPKIELKAKIASVKTGKIIGIQMVKVKMRWNTYFSRVLSFKGIFRSGHLFEVKDIEPMFYEAAYKLLVQLKKAAKI